MPILTDPQSSYLAFWGKARPSEEGEESWHSVAYHSLDVAAVANVILRANERKLGAIARLLGTTPDNARATIVALIALHDIGKFSAAFQAKREANWPTPGVWPTQILGKQAGNDTQARHDLIGSELRRSARVLQRCCKAPGAISRHGGTV